MLQAGCATWDWNVTKRHSARMTLAQKCCAFSPLKISRNSATLQAVKPTDNRQVSTSAEGAVSYGGERRQLTVMFCDLVGSTALSEKLDPEELRSLLHAYRNLCGDVIARYDGFVARYVGDGILTYFGWPTAHEDDAERAVRTALEIVQTVKRASTTETLSVRIGIVTCAVVIGEQAGAGDQSKLAVGSTPNLAARLQRLAIADQIVIAVSTRRLVRVVRLPTPEDMRVGTLFSERWVTISTGPSGVCGHPVLESMGATRLYPVESGGTH
jgi:class 3 adenylate cyclase